MYGAGCLLACTCGRLMHADPALWGNLYHQAVPPQAVAVNMFEYPPQVDGSIR